MNSDDGVSSADWLQRFRSIHPAAAYRDHDPKFGPVYVRGQGCRLWDADGNEYFDLTCGYSAANFGQAFAPLIEVAKHQVGQLSHLTGEPHVARIRLAEKLVNVLGFGPPSTKVMFNATGARAIETAWKAAQSFRPGKLLTIGPCFHGRSIATLALGSNTHATLEMLNDDRTQAWPVAEFPYCGVCPLGLSYPACNLACVERLLQFIATQAHELSAILVEPAIGARGYLFPPADFFRRLRSLTDQAGVLLVADEIQSGLGRCGDWLLSRRQGWQADLVVLGKSLGGGIAPISAVIGRKDVLDALPIGCESETFAATPLASAIAIEVLTQLESGGWMRQGAWAGQQLREHMSAELGRNAMRACTVEGEAASCVFEFAGGIQSPISPADLCAAQRQALIFAQKCFAERLLVQHSGPYLTRVILLPPLTVAQEDLAEIIARLKQAMQATAQANCR